MIELNEFLRLRSHLPIIDVRSENEFAGGHIHKATNIPILNNAERIIIGTTYKHQGQAAAIKEGFRLVGPRLIDIIEAAQATGNECLVHCWRGGMRSANFCQFVGIAGIKTFQLKGGYKVYRNHALESLKQSFQFRLITGNTGSGKSQLLATLKKLGEQVLDLESLARHKGSVFGGLLMPPQPTTEQFQNDIFEEVRTFDLSRPIWVEDESIAIGKIFLPLDLWKRMGTSPLFQIDVARDIRIRRLTQEYKQVPVSDFISAMTGIQKKMGGQHFKAAEKFLMSNDLSGAIDVILNYYDKAYANGLQRKKDRIKLRVDWDGTSPEQFAKYLMENRGAEL